MIGYGVTKDGVIIGVEGSALTLAQALDAQRGLRKQGDSTAAAVMPARRSRRAGRKPKAALKAEKVTTTEISGDTVSVLSEIAKSDKAGIPAKDLAVKCGLGSAKGLSGLMRKARQVISEKSDGKSIGKYLWKKRTRDRGAVWYVNSQKLRDIGVIQ